MDAKSGEIVDHKNLETLDNRRANLRIVTAATKQKKVIQAVSILEYFTKTGQRNIGVLQPVVKHWGRLRSRNM